MKYSIRALERFRGQWVYHVQSEGQGIRMMPNADSLARQFESKGKARAVLKALRLHFAGLKDWELYKRIEP